MMYLKLIITKDGVLRKKVEGMRTPPGAPALKTLSVKKVSLFA